MPFTIVQQDITKMKVDAIVNATNTELLMGDGVCGAIFHAAGADKLQAACDKGAPIKTGEAVITSGFALPAKYVIHSVGPIYDANRKKQCEALLRSAYTQSLKLAVKNKCESVAFPLISSGIYGYPPAEALRVATEAITDFLSKNDIAVYLAVFGKTSFVVSEQLMDDVGSYLDKHYINAESFSRQRLIEEKVSPPEKPKYVACAECMDVMDLSCPLANLVDNLDASFADTLFKLIERKGKTDAEIYKKANIDRRLFSKIRTQKNYTPKKQTILALAIALELSLSETSDLLERAGYALSHANKFDVIVEYFIVRKKYNIFNINEVLFKYDQPLLGC